MVFIGLVTFFAAATYYIGWFLAIFFTAYMTMLLIQSILYKNLHQATIFVLAIMLCLAMPIIWLLNNLLMFGNPFHPMIHAKQLQELYIGQLPILSRLIVIPNVFIGEFGSIILAGIISVFLILYQRHKIIYYLLPSAFTLMMIFFSTLSAMSAPYQEPRYLVFIGWVLIPVIGLASNFIMDTQKIVGKIVIVICLIIVIICNVIKISHFRNSFDSNVKAISCFARDWFRRQPATARIIIEGDTYAEKGVIPVISGYPSRVIYIQRNKTRLVIQQVKEILDDPTIPWIYITKDKKNAKAAVQQGLLVRRIGIYYIISQYE
ncbi:MAG: hypothetical protein ANABAC_3658 [Anaerolineae bacterium]|nr:MAG: hypothetical protein ANABAC_3658 [Anaerolineae bacterium]